MPLVSVSTFTYSSDARATTTTATIGKTEKVVSSSKFFAVVDGIAHSRIYKMILIGTGAAIAFSYGLPITAGALLGVLLLSFIYCVRNENEFDKTKIEVASLFRMFFRPPCNLMHKHESGAKLYLGHLPNRIGNNLENFSKRVDHQPFSILSFNSPWEKEHRGGSIPYTLNDEQDLGIENHKTITAKDHAPLSVDEIGQAVEFIEKELQARRHVYVHCVAGSGRSATAVAAYLLNQQENLVIDTNPRRWRRSKLLKADPDTLDSVDLVAGKILKDRGFFSSISKFNKLQGLRTYVRESLPQQVRNRTITHKTLMDFATDQLYKLTESESISDVHIYQVIEKVRKNFPQYEFGTDEDFQALEQIADEIVQGQARNCG